MRLIVPAAAALLLAACASNPKPVAAPIVPAVAARPSANLTGLNAVELAARFGPPALQVREGEGTKLQFRSQRCVLDAYLYPPPGRAGVARVTHVDSRDREGRSVAASTCITAIEAR